tara:strand:+ start:1682 stop:2377 length:696 start_codon:yes stop_codon:yes gene_type:complete
MKIFAFIFARGGSKGVPGKNIKQFCGKPLISYSINIAKEIKDIEKVFVSTEDDQIADIAANLGAVVIPRPIDLSKDDSPEWLAWQHAVKWVEKNIQSFDTFVSLPTTSPLRDRADIVRCLSSLKKNTDLVLGITLADRNPWFNMVKQDRNGSIKLLMDDGVKFSTRQETPAVYNMTTVAYVSRPKFILQSKGIFNGNVTGVEIPAERSLDIDTELDFKIAEFLMKERDNYN